jgi:hypothetical protein
MMRRRNIISREQITESQEREREREKEREREREN